MRIRGLPRGNRGVVRGIRTTLDVQRVGRAISGPGVDSRSWLQAGTVGVLDDRGEFVTTGAEGRNAVACEADGAVVDVRLEPSSRIVTARYHGVAVGRWAVLLVPLAPGDEVVVAIPDGDFNSPAIAIVGVAGNATVPFPTDWANDRVLIQGLTAPVQIRGPAVSIESPNLTLNGRRVSRSTEPL